MFENDGLRRAVLAWAASRAGLPTPQPAVLSFADVRENRIDRIADTLEAHLDLDRLWALVASANDPGPARIR